MQKSRRRMLKVAGALGAAGLSSATSLSTAATANGSLPAILLLLLDGPNFYTGTVDLPEGSPFSTLRNLPLCIKETDSQIIFTFVSTSHVATIAHSTEVPRQFPFAATFEFFDAVRLIFTGNRAGSQKIVGSVVVQTFTGTTIHDTSAPLGFTATSSPTPCELESTKAVFSNCVVTRSEEAGGETAVEFGFLIQTDPPIDYTSLGTIGFDLTFQPSNAVFSPGAIVEPDAQGAGQYLITGFHMPVAISGQDSVEVKIKSYDGLDDAATTGCTVSADITVVDPK